jgi:hypothetical protein
MGGSISVSGSLDKPENVDYWKDIKDYESLKEALHLKCGGDKDRVRRFLRQLSLFIYNRPDIKTLEELYVYIYYNRAITTKQLKEKENQSKAFWGLD